jgi:endoglucanase
MVRTLVLAALVLALAAAPPARAERVLTPQARLWVDPDSSTAHVDTPEAQRLAQIPSATWLTGGDPYGEARNAARAAQGAVPVFVAYNIPGRDCGSYSKGGAGSDAAYRRWIGRLAKGISTRAAVVIVEPDALASGCVKTSLVKYAVTRLAKLRRTGVYIDAGNSNWQPAATMRRRLRAAAIDTADGFALNVSNFRTNRESILYAKQLGGWRYVIDTSRNGQGPWTGGEPDWCNPPGRGLGTRPQTTTNQPRLDAFLWVKTPGESDGECRDGPAAGTWFPQQAADLIKNANPPLA